MKRIFLSCVLLMSAIGFLHAQAVSINTDASNPAPSAILDVKSTDKGVLVPRMTTAQRTLIAAPATGLLVFDTDTGGFWFYNGTAWTNLSGGATFIADTDGDTKIQTEEIPDEDILRFDLAGSERLALKRNAGLNTQLEWPNNNNNIFIGNGAGNANTSGGSNTTLGNAANVSAGNLTNATAIGANAIAGASNTLVLGSVAGVNGAGSGVNVGIGTTTPGEKLEVAGAIKIGNTMAPTPAPGTIRWNEATQDFEGYTGIEWKSLTKFSDDIFGANPIIQYAAHENNSASASDGAAYDYFGYSVAISGDYAIVGAYAKDIGGNADQGKAYIFVRSGTSWSQQAMLTASDGAADDYFGCSVAISGDYAIVGAYGKDIGGYAAQGKAYIFVRSGTSWSQQAMLTASDGAPIDYFGYSVAISGDYAIVGAFGKNINGLDQGKAYIFVRSGTSWSQQAMLTASDGAAGDYFGWSVAISGDYAIVGAVYKDVGGVNDQGKAYIFVRSGGTSWSQQAMLTASDGAADDVFGHSVAISGDQAIVGAIFQEDVGGNSAQGKAYIFVRSGTSWSQQATLTASDGAASDFFGYSVAISGDYAIVGAYGKNINGNLDQGKAYIFVRSGTSWSQQAMLTASDGAANDSFGRSAAISGDYAIVGAYGKDIGGNTTQGKVYFFFK